MSILILERVALWVNNNVTYIDFFGVEHIPKEIKAFINHNNNNYYNNSNNNNNNENIINIFRIQAYDSIMCVYFCIGFIDRMLAGKKLTDYTNLFFPMILKRLTI